MGWLVQIMWFQKQSSVWYGALQAQLSSFHQGEETGTALTQACLAAQRWQTGCAGGTQHPASNARQIPSQLGLRQEGRIFPPVLPLSWSFLPVLWGLQCSNKLDKGPMGTISSEDMHSTELYSETRWVY